MFPIFLSCFKWDANGEEWVETGASINICNVDYFRVRQIDGPNPSFSFDCCFAGDPPSHVALVSGAIDRDHACGLSSALLENAGIPHYPPLEHVEIEQAKHPGRLDSRPGMN